MFNLSSSNYDMNVLYWLNDEGASDWNLQMKTERNYNKMLEVFVVYFSGFYCAGSLISLSMRARS